MSITPSGPGAVTDEAILQVVMQAMSAANLARDPAAQLTVSPEAAVFGPDSPLDSLGLVALLMDIEEGLQGLGCAVSLSDERAVSQKRSPFRSVPSLLGYIGTLVRE